MMMENAIWISVTPLTFKRTGHQSLEFSSSFLPSGASALAIVLLQVNILVRFFFLWICCILWSSPTGKCDPFFNLV